MIHDRQMIDRYEQKENIFLFVVANYFVTFEKIERRGKKLINKIWTRS